MLHLLLVPSFSFSKTPLNPELKKTQPKTTGNISHEKTKILSVDHDWVTS